jgi:DNA replication protein DnaC
MNRLFDIETFLRQWWLDRHGQELHVDNAPATTKGWIDLLKTQYPDDYLPFAAAFCGRLASSTQNNQYTEREILREELRRQADKDFNITYSTDRPIGLPPEPKTLAAFKSKRHPDVTKAYNAVSAWLKSIYQEPRIVTLGGPPGTGKSHLLEAATVALVERDEQVLYRSDSDLMEEWHKSLGAHKADSFFWEIADVPWLVWDEMGLAATGDTGKALVDRIVDHRWRLSLKTLIATNLQSKGLSARVASRLQDRGMATVVTIAAPDYRIEGK